MMFLEDVVKPTMPLKEKLKYATFYAYLLIIGGFVWLSANQYNIAPPILEAFQIKISKNTPEFISSISELMWPIAVFLVIFLLRNPIKFLITQGRWEIDSKIGKFTAHGQQEVTRASDLATEATRTHDGNPIVTNLVSILRRNLNTQGANNAEDRENRLLQGLANALLREQFEASYNIIFGSQLLALQALKENGRQTLQQFFNMHVNRIKEENIPISPNYEGWLQFIQGQGFVEINENIAAITPMGSLFLDYVSGKNYPLDKRL